MKTTTFILAILMSCVFNTISINAGSGVEQKGSNKQLKETIESLFQNVPVQDYIDLNERISLEVKFRINDNNEIADVHVDCDNQALAHYISNKLTQVPIRVSSDIEHKNYSIILQFIYR